MTFLDALQTLAADPAAPLDVAEVALLFAADEYPDLDRGFYIRKLDRFAADLAPMLDGTLEDRVSSLTEFLFDDEGFQGNDGDYYDPKNSYLNDVIDRRLGLPISLSVLAMVVGQRAGLHIEGVGLPGHFVAKAIDGPDEVYFDPFHGGQLLTPASCRALVEAVTGCPLPLDDVPLESVPLGVIVARMLNNLKGVYLKREDYGRAVRVMERLRVFDPDDLLQRRDLGVALVRAGRPGAAIDHLTAYLAEHSYREDAELVQAVLHDARKEMLHWN
jgi:regulator of sirC expression with transglutaminase-like and TPR domain